MKVIETILIVVYKQGHLFLDFSILESIFDFPSCLLSIVVVFLCVLNFVFGSLLISVIFVSPV